jgi:UDP-GlcNAc3NAcA epimerase
MSVKIITIIGARPQFVKSATISRELALHKDVREVIVHTGQHFDPNMSDVFFEELAIPTPSYNLGIGGGSHGTMTGRQLEAIEDVLEVEKPDRVVVYGDTNSTLAGALAAAKLNISVAHVEAGLRSFNRRMPEEINRILTDHASDILLAPTATAIANLRREGLPEGRLHLVGDVMFDAALYNRTRSKMPSWFSDLKLERNQFILATIHRAENTDDPVRLRSIFDGLASSGNAVVLPLHPRTRACIQRYEITPAPCVYLVSPVSYLEMAWLEANALLIATDSGGVQKEAYFYRKPCVTLRDETEWIELVDTGWNILVGADAIQIGRAIVNPPTPSADPFYGDGNAASKIVEWVLG